MAIKDAFASTRAQAADSLTSKTAPLMSLKEALTSKFIHCEKGFSALIRAVLENRLQPVAKYKDSPGIMAYAFKVDDLTPFKRETSTGVEIAPRGYLKYGEAAGAIGVNRLLIGQLVTHGHLTSIGQYRRAKLLRSAEGRRFAAKYVPSAVAARVWNITSQPSRVISWKLFNSIHPYSDIPPQVDKVDSALCVRESIEVTVNPAYLLNSSKAKATWC